MLHGGSPATFQPDAAYAIVPAIDNGNPIAATVPMARCVLTLHHVRKGTPTAAAPPPMRLEMRPAKIPIAASPAFPGRSREGFGRMLNTICAVTRNMTVRKKYLRNAVDKKCEIAAPAATPARSPGVMLRTIGQSTAPWR